MKLCKVLIWMSVFEFLYFLSSCHAKVNDRSDNIVHRLIEKAKLLEIDITNWKLPANLPTLDLVFGLTECNTWLCIPYLPSFSVIGQSLIALALSAVIFILTIFITDLYLAVNDPFILAKSDKGFIGQDLPIHNNDKYDRYSLHKRSIGDEKSVILDGPTWLSLIHELWEQDGVMEDPSCAQHTLCRMNRMAMASSGQAGWAVSLSSLPLSYLLHHRHNGGFTGYVDASLMGRSGANCTMLFNGCPRLH